MKQKEVRSSILEMIHTNAIDSSVPFPPIRSLARELGASPVTVFKVIKQLRTEGAIVGGGRFRIGVATDHSPDLSSQRGCANSKEKTKKWQRISGQMQQDLANGVFGPDGRLPSIKVLCANYRAAYATVKKAISALIEKRVLSRTGNGFQRPHFATATRRLSRLLLIVNADSQGELVGGDLYEEMIGSIERLCLQANVTLEILTFSPANEPLRFSHYHSRKPYDFSGHNDVIGCMCLVYSHESMRDDLSLFLARLNKPLAILDDVGSRNFEHTLLKSRNARLFTLSLSDYAGRDVGQYLLDRNHRRIAYISPLHGTNFSQQRLTGLRKVLGAHEVLSCTLDKASLQHFSPAASALHDVFDKYTAFQSMYLNSLPHEVRFEVAPLMSAGIPDAFAWGEMYRCAIELFEAALSDRSITAWVGVNDGIARMAQDFLARKKIKVPGRISVMGFDDSHDALRCRLTTYNFNMAALAQSLIGCVLGDPAYRFLTYGILHTIGGKIIERGTVAQIA